MYDFSLPNRTTLGELNSATERMVVQRWVELAFEHTHPEWRLRGNPPHTQEAVETVLADLEADNTNRTYHSMTDLAAESLIEGGTPQWQFNSAQTYLLNGASRTNKSFADRLRDLCSKVPPPDMAKRAEVEWRAESELSKSRTLPWSATAVSSANGDADGHHTIVAGAKTVESKRAFALHTRVERDTKLINRAAARVQLEGAVAIDIARLASLPDDLRLRDTIDVRGSASMDYVRIPAMPGLTFERVGAAANAAYEVFQADPDDIGAKQAIASLRWLSLAAIKWRESPSMAATILYIALETAHQGCIVRHKTAKHETDEDHNHETALDRYVRTLQDRLAGKVEDYLLRLWGSRREIDRGRRRPHPWMGGVPLRQGGVSTESWAKRLMRAMSGSEGDDPLLRFHLAELVTLRGSRLIAIKERCREDLEELRLARNELVHDTDLLLSEERSTYLASLALEMLLLRIEEVGDRTK